MTGFSSIPILIGSAERIKYYFDGSNSHEDVAHRYPVAMKSIVSVRLNARTARDTLLLRGGPIESRFMRCTYRPFDNRWLYWEDDSGLLARPRPEYKRHVFAGNQWLSAARHLRKGASEPQACFARHIGQLHLIERSASMFPMYLRDDDRRQPPQPVSGCSALS